MTTFINQRMSADCMVAALAMALGVRYNAVARHCSGTELVDTGLLFCRVAEIAKAFKVKVKAVPNKAVDWKKSAILRMPSLNTKGDIHAVYWDGQDLWDPLMGVYGKAIYKNEDAKTSCISAIVLAD